MPIRQRNSGPDEHRGEGLVDVPPDSVQPADEDIASESVKQAIKKIIGDEDQREPHSDQKIVEILAQQDIVIARRTVAKYREMLGILSSSKRKKYF